MKTRAVTRRTKVLGVAMSLALVGAACGDDDDATANADSTTTTEAASPAAEEAVGIEAEAVALRGDLTLLLRNHVNLTGNVVYTAAESGLDSEQLQAAMDALDENTVALGSAIGGLFGEDAEAEFLRQWREHIGFFVDYAKGIATGDQQLVQMADENLRGQYAEDFSAFVSSATDGALPQAAVKENLMKHIDTLEQGIAAVLQEQPAAATHLLEAGRHMDATAEALATGFASVNDLGGDPASPTADLLSTLTGAFEQHVAQTAYVVHSAALHGLESEQVTTAMAALDENTKALGAAIGSVYGDAAEQQFLEQWRQHIDFFVQFATGVATDDQQLRDDADMKLREDYAEQFSAFLADATGGEIEQEAAKDTLLEHIDTLEQTIESILGKAPGAGAELREALRHMQNPAKALSSAIVAQHPEMFGG